MKEVRVGDHVFPPPYAGCYGCRGTGKLQGFGRHTGSPCPACTNWCSNHDANCDPEED